MNRYMTDSTIGDLMMQHTRGGAKKIVVNMEETAVNDVAQVLEALDEEFLWSEAGEGYALWKRWSRHSRHPKGVIDRHLLEHETRYTKLRNAIFPDGVEVPSELHPPGQHEHRRRED